MGLEFGIIRLSDQKDSLSWSHDKYIGALFVAQGYECIVSSHYASDQSPVLDFLWNLNIPTKICCFIWLLVRDRVLTWDKLQSRGRQGLSLCILCRRGEDTMQHIFVDCLFSRSVFSAFGDYYGIPSIPHNSVNSFLE